LGRTKITVAGNRVVGKTLTRKRLTIPTCSLAGFSGGLLGSRPAEFCRIHDLALSTLQRHLKRRRSKNGEARARGQEDEQAVRVTLSQEELSLLLGGIDLAQTRRKDWYRREVEFSEKVGEKLKAIKHVGRILV
jgi:hypothetical protein